MKLFLKTIICLCFFWLTSDAGKPYLLFFSGVGGEETTPNIVNNLAYIETLPFDGLVIVNAATWNGVTNNVPMNYTTLYDIGLKPLQGKFTKLKHNFQQVNECKPVDFFDDWTIIIQNWRLCARACKAAGMVGIFYDNEYVKWDYPGSCKYPSKTIQEYRDQARLRGRQVMEACVAEFPEIRMLTVHGPYVSERTSIMLQGGLPLAGPFFVGMVEGQGSLGLNIDGGEVYGLRTVADFESHYQFRKYTIASATQNSPNIPVSLRPEWPNLVSISFGVYNRTYVNPMDPTIMRTTMENALRRCDDYVWLYTEGDRWMIPGGVTADWINAVRNAYNAVKTGIFFSSPTRASVQTNNSFSYKVTYDNFTGASATLTYLKKPSWIIATNGNPDIYGTAPNTPSQDTLRAIVSAGGKADTLSLVITVSTYLVIEAETGTLTPPMQIGSDPSVSGGQYISTPAGTGNTISPKVEATYSVNIPVTGAFYVWLRIYKQTINVAANYGTFVGFNGTFSKPGILDYTAGKYEWSKSSTAIKLSAGANQMMIGHGNEQVYIDKIIITNSADAQLPSGMTSSLPGDKKNVTKQKPNLSIRTISKEDIEFIGNFGNSSLAQLSVVDIAGRTVWSYDGKGNGPENRIVWNTKGGNSGISNGLYFAVLNPENGIGSEIKKFTLAR